MIAFLIDLLMTVALTTAILLSGIGAALAGVLVARSFLQGGQRE